MNERNHRATGRTGRAAADHGAREPAVPAPPDHHVPAPIGTFVGRDDERAAAVELLAEARLVTLAGPGGIGKTRLAIEVARAWAGAGRPAVFVDLSTVADPATLPDAVAAAVGAREHRLGGATVAVVERLRHHECLLVLDNCEHVIDATASLAYDLLQACPPLRVLATSREGLGISGGSIPLVPPLSVPGPGDESPASAAASEAVRLFCDRAGAVGAGFTLDGTTWRAVVEICRRLDGNPLAVELAAARTDMLSPEEILECLDDRFAVLVGGRTPAPPRQRTLKGALEPEPGCRR